LNTRRWGLNGVFGSKHDGDKYELPKFAKGCFLNSGISQRAAGAAPHVDKDKANDVARDRFGWWLKMSYFGDEVYPYLVAKLESTRQ